MKHLRKITLWSFLMAVVAFAALGGVWYWITTIRTDIVVKQAAVAVEAQKQQHHENLRAAVRNTEDLRKELEAYITTPDEIVAAIERIEALGGLAQTPVVFQTVRVEDETLVMAFSTEGTFADTMYFLALLETLPAHIVIDETRLERPQETPATSIWTGRFRITIRSFIAG